MAEPTNLVDTTKCNGCGTCVFVCPEHVLEVHERIARTRFGHGDDCIKCGHCIMVCPTNAMNVAGLEDVERFDLPKTALNAEVFETFLHSRRSVRRFKNEPVDRQMLTRIVEMAATAPMGIPPHTTSATIIDNHKDVRRLFLAAQTGYQKMINAAENPIGRMIIRFAAGKENFRMLADFVFPTVARANAEFEESGADCITWDAPAMILFGGKRDGISYKENAFLVGMTALYAAHALGLGATMSGLIPPIVDRSKELRKRLRIPDNETILTGILVGHPNIRFKRGMRRPLLTVRFA